LLLLGLLKMSGASAATCRTSVWRSYVTLLPTSERRLHAKLMNLLVAMPKLILWQKMPLRVCRPKHAEIIRTDLMLCRRVLNNSMRKNLPPKDRWITSLLKEAHVWE
jgi:hypothetical protein